MPRTLAAVRPNEGLQAIYRAKLDRLIGDMHASLLYWLSAAYRQKPPELAQMAADDAFIDMSSAMAMRQAMRKLTKRWQRNFDKAAPELARWFSLAAQDRSDRQLQAILRRAGIAVPFKMTAAANDVMQATIGEQVGLIRSIAQQHLSQVETLVMRSVSEGRELGTLADELEARYGVTKRRAALIATDQNNKATASMHRVRQLGLGIKQAQWCHSHAGAHPRPSHVKAAADKVVYDVEKGWFDPDEQQYIWPGTLIRCWCFSKPILPF